MLGQVQVLASLLLRLGHWRQSAKHGGAWGDDGGKERQAADALEAAEGGPRGNAACSVRCYCLLPVATGWLPACLPAVGTHVPVSAKRASAAPLKSVAVTVRQHRPSFLMSVV